MKQIADLNPRTKHYEFLGPPGALAITLLVPITTYALYFGCSEAAGGCPPPLSTLSDDVLRAFQSPAWWKSLWDTDATIIYFAWYAFCVVAWFFLPADWVDGVMLRTGVKKQYKINGMLRSLFYQLFLSLRVSLFHVPTHAWPCVWLHLPLRSPILHILLRQMGRFCNSVCSHGHSPSGCMLRGFLPRWQTVSSGRQQRKLRL